MRNYDTESHERDTGGLGRSRAMKAATSEMYKKRDWVRRGFSG